MKNYQFPYSVSLVIPLCNNGKTLVVQLKECADILDKTCSKYEIIICEDGSTDNSRKLLEQRFQNKPFKLIVHKTNLGIAKTTRELYKKASYDYVLLFSVDGDWDPLDIKKLLLFLKKTKSDIVIGKRNSDNFTFYRKIISVSYNFLCYLFFQVKTDDAGSIKVMNNKILKNIKLTSKSVFSDAEIIIRARKMGYKISSTPVYFKKKEKKSGSGGRVDLVIASFIDLIKLRFTL